MNRKKRYALALSLLFIFLRPAFASSESLDAIFEKCWKNAKENIYPAARERGFFTAEKYRQLKTQVATAKSLDDLSAIINPFLSTLHVSHTHFYTSSDPEFYFLRSLFSTKRIDRPSLAHIGAQYILDRGRYHIRSVLEGYPAEKAGLRRGDIILEADGEPFQPVRSLQNKSGVVSLAIDRNGSPLKVEIKPINESFHLSRPRPEVCGNCRSFWSSC